MKVVVINLDKNPERWIKVSSQLNNLNINYERYSAVYGKDLSSEEIESKTTMKCRNFLCNKGIIGCALSHMNIWKTFVEDDTEPFLCVLEDDADILPDFAKFLNDAPGIYKELNFDIISLYCIGFCSSKNTEKSLNINNHPYVFSKPIFPLSTVCYIISRNGAEKLIKVIGEKVIWNIDFVIATEKLFNDIKYFYLKSPTLISTNLEDSNLVNVNSGGVTNNVLTIVSPKLKWYLNMPVLNMFLKTPISIYVIFLLITIAILLIYKKYLWASVFGIELFLVCI